jgi:hypothetical protein
MILRAFLHKYKSYLVVELFRFKRFISQLIIEVDISLIPGTSK